MKKKILFVVDERKMGGVSIVLEDILNKIDYNRVSVDLLVLHNAGDRFAHVSKEVKIIFGTSFFNAIDMSLKEAINKHNLMTILQKFFLIFSMKTGIIRRKIKQERKKILIDNYDVEIAFKDGFTALFTSCGDSRKKVHWLHYEYGDANPNRRYDRLFQSVMRSFDEIVAVSSGVLEAFEKVYELTCMKRVIPNIIDANRIISMSQVKKFTGKTKKISIGSIGRLHQIKGYDRFFECLALLKKEKILENVQIFIIGDGPERSKLELSVEKNKLNDIIVFMGAMDNPYYILCEMDLFILPSYFESFGLVCLESLILNVPVLATKTSGTIDIFKTYTGGLLVDNENSGIINGLRFLLSNTDNILKLKKEINYTSQNEADKVNKIMEVLCND